MPSTSTEQPGDDDTDPIPGFIVAISVLCFFGGTLFGIGIFVYQIIFWLINGSWKKIPVETLLELFQPSFYTNGYSWYYRPDSWIGVNKIIVGFSEKMPLSLFIPLLALFICFGIWLAVRWFFWGVP